MTKKKKSYWIESITDTGVALAMNLPINFAILSYAFHLELDAAETTVFATTVFTVLAIVRKYIIRKYFDERGN